MGPQTSIPLVKLLSKTTPYNIEWDNYLNDVIIPKSLDFDILVWWKMNGVKFPKLQAIARDLLAIPVTSVTSESAFSAGGRILNPHRSNLGQNTVKSMLCTKSWVHDELKIDSKVPATALDGCFMELLARLDEEGNVDATDN
ncbi:Putative AC transposase [Linum perenne]